MRMDSGQDERLRTRTAGGCGCWHHCFCCSPPLSLSVSNPSMMSSLMMMVVMMMMGLMPMCNGIIPHCSEDEGELICFSEDSEDLVDDVTHPQVVRVTARGWDRAFVVDKKTFPNLRVIYLEQSLMHCDDIVRPTFITVYINHVRCPRASTIIAS